MENKLRKLLLQGGSAQVHTAAGSKIRTIPADVKKVHEFSITGELFWLNKK